MHIFWAFVNMGKNASMKINIRFIVKEVTGYEIKPVAFLNIKDNFKRNNMEAMGKLLSQMRNCLDIFIDKRHFPDSYNDYIYPKSGSYH